MSDRWSVLAVARQCSAALLLALACCACTTTAPRSDWEYRLRGDAVVMLGEVHDNVELEGPLPGGSGEKPEGGGVRLQDHGNPVRFRNIWVVPGK